MAIERLAIVGTGLIGASVGLAAKRAGVSSVVGYDPDSGAVEVARERGAIDESAPDLGAALARAELALVCAPVSHLPGQVQAVLEHAAADSTVSDVGSTKRSVCLAAADDARFIGGHPVCGSEAHGPEHANGELFQGATWFLTPVTSTDHDRYKTLHRFVASLGALPIAIDPLAHDRLIALTSHLPHALSNLIANQAGATRVDGHEPLLAAGGSLRDMTRVAGANPRIWVDIFLENADPLREALVEHRRRVEQLEAALEARDAGFLARWIAEAAGQRRRLLEQAYPDPGVLHRLRVRLPDRPGVLAGITQALGAERINIEDFDMQHLSPERGGALSLIVAGEEQARRAADLLEAQGYGVVVSSVVGDEGQDA